MATINIQITAIKLTEDLIAERGDYLLVFADDRIEIADKNSPEARQIALQMGQTTVGPTRQNHVGPTKPRAKPIHRRKSPTTNRNGHRIIYKLGNQTHTMPLGNFNVLMEVSTWEKPQKINGLNNSGQAGKLRDRGLLEHDYANGLWSITSKGRDVIAAIAESNAKPTPTV